MGAKGVEINAPFGCGHQLAMATNQPIKVAKGVENRDNEVGLGQDTHIPFPSQLHSYFPSLFQTCVGASWFVPIFVNEMTNNLILSLS